MTRKDIGDLLHWSELAQHAEYRVALLSLMLGVSQRQLERYIKGIYGCTPHFWLKKQRLERAAKLLANGQPAKTVCFSLGFKQLSHFSREFKSYYKLSPNDFLRSH